MQSGNFGVSLLPLCKISNKMKKIIAFGLLIAGFAMASQAQTASQNVSDNANSPAIAVANVSPTNAVAPTKACCKKEGAASGCSKSGSASAEVKACCKKEGSSASASVSAIPVTKSSCGGGAEHKCDHEGASAATASNTVAPISAPGAAPMKKACAGGTEGKPCCKK